MTEKDKLGGAFKLPGTSQRLSRIGYGAMQLPGPHVWGPPKDRETAIAVLRKAVSSGVNHIDTADFYGPEVANELIRDALYPYDDDLVIVTKVGYMRGADKSWLPAKSSEDLERSINANLKTLRLEAMDIVNLRVGNPQGPGEGSIEQSLKVLVALKKKGLIRNIGLSNVTLSQFNEATSITDIVCVQNYYNVAQRADDDFIDTLAGQGIPYVPFFPLGGFSPLQSSALDEAARALKATPMQIALVWLYQRSPNILLIPGTSSMAHLNENLRIAEISIPPELLTKLNSIAGRRQ